MAFTSLAATVPTSVPGLAFCLLSWPPPPLLPDDELAVWAMTMIAESMRSAFFIS
jgi:hypothetical protein